MNNFDYKPYYQRNLPHIQPSGATFFVTFHLVGSLPRSILQHWKTEKYRLETEKLNILKLQNDKRLAAIEEMITKQKRQWFIEFEKTLDKAENGPVWLKDERIAEHVGESLHYRDGRVYRLEAYCIMANHVHVVFVPLPIQSADAQTDSLCYNSLSSIMHSLKGYTARKANQFLGRRGEFWHHESYDHCIRNSNELTRIIRYVLNNPVKAGLVDTWEEWQWSYLRTENC